MEFFVEGWTAPIDYQLKKGNPAAPFDASGMTVELVLRSKDGTEIAEVGPCIFQTPATSIVRYTPNATDLTKARSPIFARWKVTSGTEVAFFPKGIEGEEWIISK